MKNNITELVCILDKSGSMAGMEADTIGGFNAMIEKQKKKEGTVYVSTVLFSDRQKVVHDRVDIQKVEPLNDVQYAVNGCTALFDAIGDAIQHIRNVHKYARAEDVPAHTVFVITTDGMENASQQYDRQTVHAMITEQKEEAGWEFLFVAANIDAAETAESIGIKRDCAANYSQTKRGTRRVYDAVDCAVSAMRACGSVGDSWKEKLKDDEEALQ